MVFSFLSLLLGVSSAAQILSSYDFGTKGLVLQDTSTAKVIGDLALQGDVSWLNDRVGVRIGATGFLSSINNITNLLPRIIATNGFSVEMFVEIDYDAPSNLGDPSTGAVVWGISTNYTNHTKPTECPTSDPVYNPANTVEVRYTDVDGNNNRWFSKIPSASTGCQGKNVAQAGRYSGLVHIVLTASKFYVDGSIIPTMTFSASNAFFPNALDPLSLFYVAPIQNESISFVGNLYKLYIYDSNLTGPEIGALSTGWIQNSPPYVSDKTVNLYEDGSQLFSLTAFDFDDQNQTQNVTCYVASLPEKGWLTQNGVNITIPFGVPRDEVSLLYTPPQYGHGANYTNFSFYCADAVSDSNNATVFFNISHVNHPPTCVNASTQAIRYQWTRIWLNGTDIDGDKINSVRISSLPQSGYLKQVTNLAAVGAGPDIVAPAVVLGYDIPKGYVVDYRFNLSVGTSGNLFVQNDTFTYSVADPSGVWSVENATVTAIVNNNLKAGYTNGSTPNVTVKQSNENSNGLQTITLPGSDSAGNPWEVVILSLPDPLQGWFVDTDGVTNITSIPYTCTLPLIGNPKNQIYFKPYPIKKDPLSFSYAIQQQGTTWQSPPQQAMVKITPVQQVPSVVMNSNPLQLKDGVNGSISVQLYDPNIDAYSAADIGTVGDGYIVTVKGAIGSKASGRYWISCGTCVDSLIQDTSPCPTNVSCGLNAPSPVGLIRFFCHKANKTNFEMAISHIAVKGFVPGPGTIQVSIRDGGQSTAAAKFASFTPASYETTVELAFTYESEQPKGNGSYADIPPWGLYCIYVGGSALFIIILFLCVRWCFKCCLCCQRKKTEPCDNYEAAACDRL